MKILDPVAPRRELNVPLALGLTKVSGATLGLVDNNKPGATEVLKGLQRALELEGAIVAYRRKPHPVMAAPFLGELEASCSGVVIAVGDCGSGTSWSVQDLIRLENAGIPTVLLVIRQCQEWASAEARASGLPNPRLAIIDAEVEFMTPDEVEELGASAAADVITALCQAG